MSGAVVDPAALGAALTVADPGAAAAAVAAGCELPEPDGLIPEIDELGDPPELLEEPQS